MPSLICLLLLAMPIAAGAPQADPQDTSKTPGALDGLWTIVSSNGQTLASLGQKGTLEFVKDKYTVTMNGQVTERGIFKLDLRAKPTAIDMTILEGVAVGKTQIGLVQIVGDVLTLKTNTVGTPLRPTNFKQELWYPLIVAQRLKKAATDAVTR